MKIRSIRPEFFTDSRMAKLSAYARLLYIGLWSYCDDDGRGEYLPKRIEGDIFPFEAVDISGLLYELEDLGRIVRYTVADQEYFHIPTFMEYQKPNRKYDSKLPAPPTHCVSTADALPTQDARTADTHAVEGEGEGEVEVEVDSSSAAQSIEIRDDLKSDPQTGLTIWNNPTTGKQARREDLLWEMAEELWGKPATDTEHGRRNREIRELRKAGVHPTELAELFAIAVKRWEKKPGIAGLIRNLGDLRSGLEIGPGFIDELETRQRHQRMEETVRRLEAQRKGLPG